MTTKLKVKKSKSGEGQDVFVLVKHPMETGNRKDKATGEVIPAHYINNVDFALNGNLVVTAHLSQGVSKNPLIGVNIKGSPGDKVTVTWADNKGGGETSEATVE